MRKVVWIVAVLGIGLGLAACRRSDMRTITIDVPGMKNGACADIVVSAIGRAHLIPRERIAVDLERRTVTVTYESLNLSLKNIEFTIAESGFTADTIPAVPSAVEKLPPECR